jgi:nucleotide-binding universal stress UspA family protein
MKILLAADNSDYTRRAARHLVTHLSWFAQAPEVHVLHVHPPIPYPGAAARAGKAAIEQYLKEDSESALRMATKELDKAKIAYTATWVTGKVAEQIAAFVKKNKVDLVVMGSHGEGALSNLVLGSVATKVIATVKTPVLIVR